MSAPIKAGDSVLHKPSGETWLVASISPDENDLTASGWPETEAPVSDCELKRRATPEEHLKHLVEVANSGRTGHDCAMSLRTYWARENLRKYHQIDGLQEQPCAGCGGTGKQMAWGGVNLADHQRAKADQGAG